MLIHGLVEAVKEVFPLAEHHECARHIDANFKKYTSIQFRSLFWVASKSGTPQEFEEIMQEIRSLSPHAYEHLMERQPSTWSRALFNIDTSCDAVKNGANFGVLLPMEGIFLK
ncbi:uncharacterized protein LOC112503052 [Cynara cardunculus var. scolymus]|uniref:uncharacterized protein LOC112503052 n=1 Tax=Cynara cardunculus var. scolymus TaxID=59895 RepID=UPI000D62AB5A|nr:uncharacterized protein LOC112503052 [Cynara cardunculus var. scolymus]